MGAAPGERQYSVVSSFGLRSGLRQGGGRFAAAFEGTAERRALKEYGSLPTSRLLNTDSLRSDRVESIVDDHSFVRMISFPGLPAIEPL
jgi:hypothetical protein